MNSIFSLANKEAKVSNEWFECPIVQIAREAMTPTRINRPRDRHGGSSGGNDEVAGVASGRGKGWSIYGAQRAQPVATGRKWLSTENGSNGPIGNRWQPTATLPERMVRRGSTTNPVDASADAIGHEDRVHILPSPLVVPLPEPLTLEAELLVEPDRGLVPGEHVQLELAHAGAARPLDRRLQ
jgi:hypothetical protein